MFVLVHGSCVARVSGREFGGAFHDFWGSFQVLLEDREIENIGQGILESI